MNEACLTYDFAGIVQYGNRSRQGCRMHGAWCRYGYARYVCCSVLQCVAVRCSGAWCRYGYARFLQSIARVLQCVAVCCSVLQFVAVCLWCQYRNARVFVSLLQSVAVRCSPLQSAAVCCDLLHWQLAVSVFGSQKKEGKKKSTIQTHFQGAWKQAVCFNHL